MKHLFLFAAGFYAVSSLIAQPASFEARGIGGGGAMFFPAVNPANDDEFYVSSDLSALFHSTDFGDSYNQAHFTKLQVFGYSTFEFTANPNIAYCNFNDGNEGYPVKTTDGGATWEPLAGYNLDTYGGAYRINANYNNPSQLLVNAYGDILFSSNGGASFALVRHTVNNGAGLIMGGVFWDGNNIYIGTNEGLLVSVNGGASFSVMPTSGIPAGQVIWNFAGAKNGGTTRFVCITANASDTYNGLMPWDYYNYAKGVFTMDNGSGAWNARSTGINFGTDFVMYAAMARNNTETIYLGGHDASTGGPLVLKTGDGGLTWAKTFKTTNNANIQTGWEGQGGDKNWSWSETCFGISVAPLSAGKVLFGNYSNVQLSRDGGNTWKQAYVRNSDQHPAGSPTPKGQTYHSIGLENTTCHQVHWQTASAIMAAFSDIGAIRSTDGGSAWGFTYSGFSVNSVYRYAKSAGGALYAACSNVHDMYQSTRLQDAQLDANDANGKIVYSTDNGATWATMHTFNHPVYWVAVDPGNPNRLYASVIHFGGTAGAQQGGIYRCDDANKLAASTWTKLPNPPRTEGHPACIAVLNDGKVACSFSGRRNAAGTFTASSGVFLYDPAANTWSDRSHPGMYYWTKDLVPDPADPAQNTWYTCVFSGWGGAPNGLGGLYKTTDRGQSWTKLTGNQFDRVSSLTFNPKDPNEAYLTTETQGLWVSHSMNGPWTLVNSYPFRQPERVFFNPYKPDEMWVTSFGNGLKMGNLTPTSAPSAGADAGTDVTVAPNPAGDELIFSTASPGRGFLQVYDAAGRFVASHAVEQARTRVDMRGWAPGVYVLVYAGAALQVVKE